MPTTKTTAKTYSLNLTAPYPREELIQHGCEPHHTHVACWKADDRQSEIVVGLGDSADAASDDAARVEAEGAFTMDGGSIVVHKIAD